MKKGARFLQIIFVRLETPLIKGRFFTDADNADAPLVIIVNQAFAKKFWPNEDALGKRIVMGGMSDDPKWITIVGIVGDMRHFGLDIDPQAGDVRSHSRRARISRRFTWCRSNQDPRTLLRSDPARNPGNRSCGASGECAHIRES